MKRASPRYAVTSPQPNYGCRSRLAQIYLTDYRSFACVEAFGYSVLHGLDIAVGTPDVERLFVTECAP